MNKKGGTLTAWIITITCILLFAIILQSQIIDPMNRDYSKNYSTGIDTSELNNIQALKTNASNTLENSEVATSVYGLSLLSTWAVGKTTYQTILGFINGNFINYIVVGILGFPEIVSTIIVVLIWISIIMIIIYIFMKVVP